MFLSNSFINYSDSNIGAFLVTYDNYDKISIISNCSLFQSGYFSFSLFDLDLTILQIDGFYFFNNTSVLLFSINCTIVLSNISIFNHECQSLDGCLFSLSANSLLSLSSSAFTNVHNDKDSGNVYLLSSQAMFTNVLMVNFTTTSENAAFLLSYSSEVVVFGSHFSNYSSNCIEFWDGQLSINQTIFSNRMMKNNIKVENFGVVSCQNCEQFSLFQSYFEFNFFNVLNGGACLALSINIDFTYDEYLIMNNTFINNLAISGGSIYLFNVKAEISSCLFENNFAEEGGALYLDDSG